MPDEGEQTLSHVPLVWMVREAQKAGLKLNYERMVMLNVADDSAQINQALAGFAFHSQKNAGIPDINLISSSPDPSRQNSGLEAPTEHQGPPRSKFHELLHKAATTGRIHDCLKFNNGATPMGVIAWNSKTFFHLHLPFPKHQMNKH
jgi:hypothetical protein